ncbi:transporter [Rhizobium sp. P44RR-XXIV]|uniref:transporter n=1 Tax=Rhizobium sp. P44RR-XXIV TaxID=1921145 RepID=UPI001FEF7014|nr:transporter [Rhizobium sp. P44RR-XXIV]
MPEDLLVLPGQRTLVKQLGNAFVLFSCNEQRLYEIDAPAAWTWQQVACDAVGISWSCLSARLSSEFGLTGADARTLLDRYVELGILHACMVSVFAICMNDTRWMIESPKALSGELKELFRGILIPIKAPWEHRLVVIRKNLERYDLIAEDECLGTFSRSEIVPAVKSFLTDALLQTEFTLALHGAFLRCGDMHLLIAGPSGAGKTTLALALAADNRWSVEGDDIVLVDEKSQLKGVSFPIAIKNGSWTLLQDRFPQLATCPAYVRSDGKIVKFLPTDAEGDNSPSLRATTMIFIRRSEVGQCSLSRMAPLMAFQRLLAEAAAPAHKLTDRAFRSLGELVNRSQAFEMEVGSLEDAVQAIRSL